MMHSKEYPVLIISDFNDSQPERNIVEYIDTLICGFGNYPLCIFTLFVDAVSLCLYCNESELVFFPEPELVLRADFSVKDKIGKFVRSVVVMN